MQDPRVLNAVYNSQSAPFGPQTHMRSFGQPSVQVTAPSAVAIRPDALILKDTVTLTETVPGSGMYSLGFEFIAKFNCSVSVYQFAEARQTPNAAVSFYVDTNLYPQPIAYTFGPTARSRFPANAVTINMRHYPVPLYEFKNMKNYPLVLDITPQYPDPRPPQSHTTYLMYKSQGQNWHTIVVRQVFTFNGVPNLLQDLFGIESQEGSSECVVCLTDKKDVAIIPCRHVCLCANCAELMVSRQTAKCPICRGPVQSYMRLQVS
jgi:hypothetical protein